VTVIPTGSTSLTEFDPVLTVTSGSFRAFNS
jgi:hypothetical protein